METISESEMVTVVVIESLSFTGTTWLNTVLGSHEDAFALGPRSGRGNCEGSDACRVHGDKCEFWPAFYEGYVRGEENFLLRLARVSGKRIIVTNNPFPEFAEAELSHPQIVTKRIRLVRDGRALAASFARHYAEKGFLVALAEFLNPVFSHFPFDENDPDHLCLRYEESASNKRETLSRCSAFLGIEYGEKSLRYWEWPHHLTSGNHGFMAQIKYAQGIDVGVFEGKDFYEKQFRKLENDEEFEDKRWMAELSRGQRFLFDACFGAVNERFGYGRDQFTEEEREKFGNDIEAGVACGSLPEFFSTSLLAEEQPPKADEVIAAAVPEVTLKQRVRNRLGRIKGSVFGRLKRG